MKKKITETVVLEASPKDVGEIWIADTALPGFGLRVRDTGAKTYCIRYRTEGGRRGKTRRYTIGPVSKWKAEAARKFARRLLAEVNTGADPATEKSRKSTAITVKEALDAFRAAVSTSRKPSTLKQYKHVATCYLVPRIGDQPLERLTKRDIVAMHRSMSETPASANESVKLLRAVISWAQREEMVPEGSNPARHIELYKSNKIERFLSEEELAKIGKELASDRAREMEWPWTILALRLLLLTGARRGEIVGAKWNWIDWERKFLVLPDSKTGSKSIPLSTHAIGLLAEAQKEARSEWIVPKRTDIEQPMPPGTLTSSWLRIRARIGLEDVRLHDLRHSHASVGAGLGVGLYVVGKILGHSDSKTTERYAHLADDPMRRAAEKISGTIAAALDGKPKAEVVQLRKK